MLDLPHVRLLIRAFSTVWYVVCGLAILFGLFLFLCGLAALLDLNLFGMEFESGTGTSFLVMSLAAVAIPVVFIFVARSLFRYILAQLDEIEKQRQASTDSSSRLVGLSDEPSDGAGEARAEESTTRERILVLLFLILFIGGFILMQIYGESGP